ncbi:MAG: hypothetical protein LBD02_10665 [Christensenellaceae bacterium]|jgi:hypothetical protein|nr:hypothetical protein [Christensenellaceae bacterium]
MSSTPESKINLVDTNYLNENVISGRKPIGLFMAWDGESWIAVDNSTGDAFTEEFETANDAKAWLLEAGEF